MKTKKIFLLLALFAGFACSYAQDIHFSQFTNAPLMLNPALTSLGHNVLGIINYKDQWRSVDASPYKTFNVSGDFAVTKNKSGSHLGLGVDIFSDKAGDANMSTTTGQLHVAGVIAAGDNMSLSAGLYGGFGQRGLNYADLTWDNQYDGMHFNAASNTGEPTNFEKYNYLDVGAGAAMFYGKGHRTMTSNDAMSFTLGFGLQHLNQPVYSYYGGTDQKLPMRMIIHGNADIGIKNYNLVLQPSYIVMLQAGHHEINAGMMFKYILQEASRYTGRKKPAAFQLGGYYRFADAIVVATGYEFANYAIGLSYDMNISDLKTATNKKGGFEICLKFISPNPFGGGVSNKLFD